MCAISPPLRRERPRTSEAGAAGPLLFDASEFERAHVIHMSAQRGVVFELQSEFNRRDESRRGNVAETILWHTRVTSTINVIPPPGQT